ncbi:hypothetical protein psyc5s11_23130 [Clostridium gelidum]|uniref:ABM domain-containing protein n=2 Tax=Clostridium gelidum TaxID=704125 RepID=A0ABN6IZV5_9CLOT|nr:hypothetical protein psyc5s11_23130 [Clostridium gelidum]
MNSKLEFDSEFSNVKYIEKDNIVFLTWKKFCSFDDYRTPTYFALGLLEKYPNSKFVVDARNGFEDDKEDVEWGFSELLPAMSKTDCKYVAFIINEVNEIEEEMDLWTEEFGKYFAVVRTVSYEAAINKMNECLLVNVTYTIKQGKREEFFNKVNEMRIVKDSRKEPGNIKYEYFFQVESEDKLFLMEMWVNDVAQSMHGKTEHYKKLQLLKEEYVTDVNIEKYNISKR